MTLFGPARAWNHPSGPCVTSNQFYLFEPQFSHLHRESTETSHLDEFLLYDSCLMLRTVLHFSLGGKRNQKTQLTSLL